MKHFLLLLFAMVSPALFAQSEAETLKSAKALVADKKYESAFKLLDTFDPDNGNVEIVLMKQDILQDYFVTSMMHQMFSLKDIGKDEDIMDYRGSEGTSSMHLFAANEILDSLLVANPGNCRLHNALGSYYYDVYLRYSGNWLKSDEEILSLAGTNYTKAVEGKCGDYMSHYVLGFLDLVDQKYAESIPHFLESIKLDASYPTSHYNLAYAYLYMDDRENAVKYAKNAMERYKEPGYKADAARMAAQAYLELNDTKNALTNYELADSIDPNNYYTLNALLGLYLAGNDPKAKQVLPAFYNLDPENPTIYTDLEEIYAGYGREDELIAFYTAKLEEMKADEKIVGNIHFFLGRIYIRSDKAKAKQHFLQAKEHFGKAFEPGHDVFGIIDQGLKNLEE